MMGIDFGLCQIIPNYGASDIPDAGQYPILLTFWTPDTGRAASRRKMLAIAKELKRTHKARLKSFGGRGARYCVVSTDASAEKARDVASDHFQTVTVDLRSRDERIREIDIKGILE